MRKLSTQVQLFCQFIMIALLWQSHWKVQWDPNGPTVYLYKINTDGKLILIIYHYFRSSE